MRRQARCDSQSLVIQVRVTSKQRQVGYDDGLVYRAVFPFEFVLMMGDNMYGGESRDFKEKFEDPYKELLDAKVKFYASLGNHDQGLQVNYVNFNMDGKEYYRFKKGCGFLRAEQ